MVSLTIDGRNVTVAPGTTILEAAAEAGISIPTLCWLQKVSPTGACRVCAVEVEGVDRPMTACNTPVKEGIKVTTESEQLTTIRRKVVELLLVNHPLDCPVCDAAGECDLQDSCYTLKAAKQEYSAILERRPIRYDWTLLESDPNRCILCEKCVKVDHEIVGADAIKVVNCGEAAIIDTVDGKPLDCEFCGNCIAACPTGTLISKPFKFRGRPWAFKVMKSICPFCSTGCQIDYHSRNGRVERVTSDDSTYNSGNLCINGRFGYSYLNSPERLTAPLVKEEGTQVKADWNRAMAVAAGKIKEVVEKYGAAAVAGLGSPRVSNEEHYQFQKLMRGAIGTNNIDSEARLGYAPAQAVLRQRLGLTGASATIDRIDNADAVLVIGCDLNAESTGIEYRVIKAATKNDAKLVLANMRDVKLKKFANSHLKYRPGGELPLINGLLKALFEANLQGEDQMKGTTGFDLMKKGLDALSLEELAASAGVASSDLQEAAALIGGKRSLAIIFGADLMRSTSGPESVQAVVNLALVTGCLGKESGGLFPIDEKNNTQGLLDMGICPDSLPGYQGLAGAASFEGVWERKIPVTQGKDLWQIIEGIENGNIKALYLLGCDLAGFPEGARILKALEKLELLVVQDIFPTEMAKRADVVFPGAAAAEKSGTFTTPDKRVQSFNQAIQPPGDAREDWDILAELYNRLTGAGIVRSSAEIAAEIAGLVTLSAAPVQAYAFVPPAVSSAAKIAAGCQLLSGPILFHSGSSTTWSENNLAVEPTAYLEISSTDAGKLGINTGGAVKVSTASGSATGTVRVSDRLQPGLLFAPSHFRDFNLLLQGNANVVEVQIQKD